MSGPFWEGNLSALESRTEYGFETLRRGLTKLGPWKGEGPRDRRGEPVAFVERAGTLLPLASVFDPVKEGARFAETIFPEGRAAKTSLVIWGAAPAEVWNELAGRPSALLLSIEPRMELWQRLFSCQDWRTIIANEGWTPLAGTPQDLRRIILESYHPIWEGALKTLSWRVSFEGFEGLFGPWQDELASALEEVRSDVATQSRLGRRWQRNTFLNLQRLQDASLPWKAPPAVVVAGAGPGLETALESREGNSLLAGRPGNGVLLFAVDTALPALIQRGLEPDLVLSLDGQLPSYHHFVPPFSKKTPILADLAALPLIARLGHPVVHFLSGHPLTRVIRRFFPELPLLDASLGNVAGLGLRAAEFLGSRRTFLWGADFSYPQGKTYARGTYVYPFFQRRSTRLQPSDHMLTAFAFRTPSLTRASTPVGIRYTNSLLQSYRDRLALQSRGFETPLEAFAGPGLDLDLGWSGRQRPGELLRYRGVSGRWEAFAEFWERSLKNLPLPSGKIPLRSFLSALEPETREVWLSLLPLACFEFRVSERTEAREWLSDAAFFDQVRQKALKFPPII